MPEVAEINHRDPALAGEIVGIQLAAYRMEADLIGFDGIPNLHETVHDIQSLALTVLGIRESERLLAMVGYRRVNDVVDIDRLAVSPQHHRRGLATKLIEAVHDRESSASRFEVSTGALNEPAIALYRAVGYLEVETVTLPVGLRVIRLERRGSVPGSGS